MFVGPAFVRSQPGLAVGRVEPFLLEQLVPLYDLSCTMLAILVPELVWLFLLPLLEAVEKV